tara:strand:- start:3673 stop:3858 length:186 start_codon:yes stop_codon:yes gene_type:complete
MTSREDFEAKLSLVEATVNDLVHEYNTYMQEDVIDTETALAEALETIEELKTQIEELTRVE